MKLYTIGFTKKTASQFFELLKANHIHLLLDVRLNNRSQLAGFTKGEDLAYFLQQIGGIAYLHTLEYAPTKEMLDAYRDKKITWNDYEEKYLKLIQERNESNRFCDKFSETYAQYQNVVLLCSEPTAEKCHRRLAAEWICRSNADMQLEHL
jgi:uncharacterized protein (DUF488 family)